MAENQEDTINPTEARGRTLKEKTKNCDPGFTVAPRLSEGAAALGPTGVVFVEGARPPDCQSLIDHFGPQVGPSDFYLNGPDRRAILATSANEARQVNGEELMLKSLQQQIESAPAEIRPLLQSILDEAVQLRKLFPHKRLMGVSLMLYKGGRDGIQPQTWHRDGERGESDRGITRIMKTYHGPGTEYASEDGTRKVTVPLGAASMHVSGPGSALHRGPVVARGTWRVRLQIELG